MSSTEESLEDLVETIMTSKSEVRRLTMNKSSLHDEYLALNDQVAQEVAKAIK
jgi:DNA-binding protein YbaB